LDVLSGEEQQASLAAETALENKKAAEPRRVSFLRIEHVQNAKPLVVEFDRLINEVNVGRDSLALARKEDDAASAVLNEADTLVAAADQAVVESEQSKKNAAVDLEKARNLDARIDALKPQREQSEGDLKTSQSAETKAKTASEAAQERLNAALKKQESIEDWLKKNECSKALAEGWPRWDTLFRQASETQREVSKTLRELAAAQADESSKATTAAEATNALEKETAAMRDAEAILGTADLELAAFNVEQMTAERKHAADRLASLTTAESVWLRLEENRQAKLHWRRRSMKSGVRLILLKRLFGRHFRRSLRLRRN